MTQRFVTKDLFLATCLALSACGASSTPEPPGPRNAFHRMKQAFQAGEWEAVFTSYSPKSSDRLLLDTANLAQGMMANSPDQIDLQSVLEKHGVSVSTNWLRGMRRENEPPEQIASERMAKVADKKTLFVELMKLCKKESRWGSGMNLMTQKMKNVVVTGDSATATFVEKGGKATPAKFIRIDGVWYIVP